MLLTKLIGIERLPFAEFLECVFVILIVICSIVTVHKVLDKQPAYKFIMNPIYIHMAEQQ